MNPFWTDEEFGNAACDVCGLTFCDGHPSFLQKHSKKIILVVSFCAVALVAGLVGFLVGDSAPSSIETMTPTTTPLAARNGMTPTTATSTTTTIASVVIVLTSDEELMLNLVNQERNSQGLQQLTWCLALERSSQAHSDDMATRDYFEHASPEGGQVSDRAQEQGYDYSYVGENIAVGQRSVKEVMVGWMNSKGHRENILNPNFTHFGYAKSVGTFEGDSGYVYWTQNFGSGGNCN